MKIGIMGAMEQEIGLLRRDIQQPVHEIHGRRQYTSGQLFDRNVVTVFSRWGKVAAASTATTLIERYGVDLIIFTGIAGATKANLNIGDIVVATETIQHDIDISALPGRPRYEVPLLGISRFPINDRFINLAEKSATTFVEKLMDERVTDQQKQKFGIEKPAVVKGLIASGDQFIADPALVKELNDNLSGLQCVEMEGAAVGQVCYEHVIPMILLRVISDNADHDAAIDFPAFMNDVACQMTCGIVEELIQKI